MQRRVVNNSIAEKPSPTFSAIQRRVVSNSIAEKPDYPFTTPSGRNRATLWARPATSQTLATSSTSLYA